MKQEYRDYKDWREIQQTEETKYNDGRDAAYSTNKITSRKSMFQIMSQVEHRCLDEMKESHQLYSCDNSVLVMEDKILS